MLSHIVSFGHVTSATCSARHGAPLHITIPTSARPPRHNDVRRTSPRHAMIARPSSGGARRPMARWKALLTAHRSHRSRGKVRLSSRDESHPTLMATNRDGDETRQRQRRWPPPPPRRPAPPSLTLFFSFMIRRINPIDRWGRYVCPLATNRVCR